MNVEMLRRYCRLIGMTNVLIGRTEYLHEFSSQLSSDILKDIFVSEYLNSDGVRVFENLWFFSATFVLEAHQFTTQDDVDVTPMAAVQYLKVTKTAYDFVKPTKDSRLSVYVTFTSQVAGQLKASRENCDQLRIMVKKYFVPRLRG
jgi:hypothetical protein